MSTSALSRPGLIKPPGPRLRKHIPLKFISKHGAGGRKSSYAELNLTSMGPLFGVLEFPELDIHQRELELLAQLL